VKLALASDEDPATLRARVTSKGGTTERGIAALEPAKVRDAIAGRRRRGDPARAEMGDADGTGRLMAAQALVFVLEVFFGLFVFGFLLRFLMQTMRAPFRNPAGQAVIALTDWAVKPLRKVIPARKGYDWASLVAAYLTEVLQVTVILLLLLGLHRDHRRTRCCSCSRRRRSCCSRPRCGS
jgi:uncharacterized protein YggT (Ycf19 family)